MNTGFVTSNKKKTTVMISLDKDGALPFPDLDKIVD